MVVRNLIGPTATKPAATFDVHPGTGKNVHEIERSTAEDITRAIDTVHAGLPGWRSTPLSERQAVFARAAALIKDENSGWAKRLHEANVSETSCTDWWAGEQLKVVPSFIEGIAEAAEEALKEDEIEYHGGELLSEFPGCPRWASFSCVA